VKRRHFLATSGALLVAPSTSAQQAGRVYRVGFLVQAAGTFLIDPLLAALRPHGWVVGRNLQLETRLSATVADIGTLAKELVAARCDVIVVAGTHMALAVKQITSSVPIVMYLSGWPVEGGLVASYARPGGNITGLSTYGGSEKLWTKFMSLTAELLPSLREMGVIWDYVAPLFLEKEVEYGVGELTRAAELLKVRSRTWAIHKQGDMEDALKAIAGAPMQAVFATSGPFISQPQNWQRISEIAMRRRLPVVCDIAGSTFRNMGLLAYSVNWNDAAKRCASFVDRILRGAKAGELPIEQPTNFELVLHAGRAKAIGLAIPPAMLIRADRVIE
jgi:putative tryptophan/tyrosine transport system substrate-binding protein